jgi:hypothetical protein
MKLDSYLMLEAIRTRDTAAIINIFAARFPEIARRSNREWRLVRAPWQVVEVRLKVPGGSFCWDDCEYYIDRGIYSYDGSHQICIRDDVYGKEPGL